MNHLCPSCHIGTQRVETLILASGPVGIVLRREATCLCKLSAAQKTALRSQA